MADVDNELAAAAVELNEEAKANRRKKRGDRPEGGENLDEALSGLGDAVTQNDQNELGAGGDLEQQHVTAIDRMEAMADEFDPQPESLVYEVRDFLLNMIKARPKPWSATSQGEQRDVAAACEHSAGELVRKVVEMIAARGDDPVRVLLTKVTMGSDMVISGKVKVMDASEEDRAVSILHRAINKHVMLTVATAEDYKQNGSDAEIDPDEPGFGFEGDDEDDD